jgi:signal transduction histidine kinase
MRRDLLLLLFACLVAALSVAAQAAVQTPVEIPSEAAQVAIWPALRIVKSTDRELTPEQAAELAAGSDATTVDGPNRILGRGTVPYWALFSLRNSTASELSRMLAVETTTQFDMRLYERDITGAWRQVRSLADEAGGRVGGGTTHPVWALQLKAQQTADLLLRIEGPAIVRFPVFIYQAPRFAERERNIHLVVGVAVGICLFIAVYIGSLRGYLDDVSISLFICMLLADLVGALWLSGFLSALFPALPESTLSPIGFAAYAMLFGCGSLHARIYLNTGAWAPKVDIVLQVMGCLWLTVALLFALVFPVATRILLVWGGTGVALTLVVVSFMAARRRIPFSGFIAAAWLAYLISGLFFLIARVTDDPPVWSSSTLILVQATVVAILFGLAMSQRLMQQRDVLVAARQEALTQTAHAAAAMRERSRFFAATNHDLRQPLLGVGLFAELFKTARTKVERERHSHKLSIALKEVDDLLVGIQQLSAVNEVSHCPVFETVKLDDLLLPIIEEYRGRSAYKHITLRYVPSRLSITTHVPYFQRIVRNVLSNAIRYTEQGDRILVGCRRAGGLRLIIADTGRGMSVEQTKWAFDSFQRFDSNMSAPDGFGLGLFSTRSMANTLGMEVSLHSEEDRGTEFRIFMPAESIRGS